MDSHAPGAASPEAQNSDAKNNTQKHLVIAICVFLFVGAAVVSIPLIVCQPHKPTFTLDDVYLYPFNTSHSIGGSSNPSLMVTLTSKNPSRTDMIYGNLAVDMSIKDKKTKVVYADGMLQKSKENATWTVILETNGEIGSATQGEKGVIRVQGGVQWKIGLIYTPIFKYHVECPVIFNLKDSSSGSDKLTHMVIDSKCSVQ